MNDKNVYILGAGFSSKLGLPLQDDFLLKAQDIYLADRETYKHFADVFNFLNELSRMRNYLSYPLLNLENLFNLLEMQLFYSSKEELNKKSFVDLIIDVLKNLSPLPTRKDEGGNLIFNDAEYQIYEDFIKMLLNCEDNKRPIYPDTFITLNYDVTIETSVHIYNFKLHRAKEDNKKIFLNVIGEKDNINVLPLSTFFDTPDTSIYDNSQCRPDRTVDLLKLHGSINWENKENGENFIVPPTWNKSDKTVRLLWEKAFQALKEAKRIVFIGYSLPETDTYIKSLLALGVNTNNNLQGIYFINPDKYDVKNRCLSLLDQHFQKYCKYKEWKFEKLMTSEDGKDFIRDKLNRKNLSP